MLLGRRRADAVPLGDLGGAVGVPLGRDLDSGATVCCDPVSWFMRTGLLANPSMFVLGRPGLGKSTAVRRMALGLSGYGVHPLIFGDLKPDYVDLIRAITTGAVGWLQVVDVLYLLAVFAVGLVIAGRRMERLLCK